MKHNDSYAPEICRITHTHSIEWISAGQMRRQGMHHEKTTHCLSATGKEAVQNLL